MSIEEGLLSDDIEIIKLYVKIYLENNTKENLSEILEKNNSISELGYYKEGNYISGLIQTYYKNNYVPTYFKIKL